MNREVQRTFVLLRQLGSGRESGYARAETRDGSVKLNLVVQGFGRNAAPYAFGLTQEGLLPLGALNMDARGQGGIAAALSPTDFRQMQMLLVAVCSGGEAQIPLAGTVGRGGWIDWAQVREAIAGFLCPTPTPLTETAPAQPETPQASEAPQAQEAPQALEAPQAQETPPAEAPAAEEEPAPEAPAAETAPAPEAAPAPVADPAPGAPAEEPAQPATAEPETGDRPAAEETDLYDLPAQMDPMTEAENALRTPLPEEERHEIPALLRSAYWPQALWPLHDLFERFEEVTPFPGEEDTVYIRVPLGDAYEEIDHYLVGAKVGEGWVVGVGYLLPGAWQETPPPGMAGYEWKDGYWQSWQYVDPESERAEE